MDVMTIILLVIIAGLGYFFWQQQRRTQQQLQKAKQPFKPYGQDELRIENVGAGAVVHLTGVGPNMEDFDLKIIAKHTYREGESSWYELECDKGSEKVWIDMEEDDELELAISLRELKMRDLGLSKDDLIRMDDEEEGKFKFDGHTYWLEDSDSAVFYRYSDDKNAERFYYWDFEAESGDKFIGIEKWSDGSYDVTYSEKVKPLQITVYSLR